MLWVEGCTCDYQEDIKFGEENGVRIITYVDPACSVHSKARSGSKERAL